MSCIRTSGTVRDLGGKANALAQLDAVGLSVPEWFAIAPSAFEQSLNPAERESLLSGDIDRLRAQIKTLEPAPQVAAEISAAIATLPGERFAVRSSAVEEDGAADSFAGQLASYLFVEPDAVPRRVADVWRSAFTRRIIEYRKLRGLSGMPSPPAVLIQRMIDSACSGVAFSADPVSGRRGLAVISAVFGMGTSLVGGEADADAYEVNCSGVIERKSIAHKAVMHRICLCSDEGVAAKPVPDPLRDRQVLTDVQAVAVAALARRAAAVFGQPQDIEWAIAEDKLYILQSRPITTLRDLPDPDGIVNIWDNSNIIESYCGVTTPLTFSFARHVYAGVYRQFCRILRVPGKKIAAHESTFSGMLGLIRGRIYYNLLNWYRVLALLPGFRMNRRFMEQMMGLRENLPEDAVSELANISRKERAADLVSLLHMILALVWNLARLERNIARFRARLDDALREPSPPLAEMRLDELTAYYAQLEAKLLQRWDAPLVNDFFAMIFHGALRKLTAQWLGDESGALANDAIRASGAMVSAEPAARVRELAAIAATDPEFVTCLCEAPILETLRAVRRHPQFQAPYEAYLDKFGDRCLGELKLESETLDESPEMLLRNIGQLARPAPSVTSLPQAGDPRRRAEEQLQRNLRRSPLKRILLTWVLRQARARVLQRENLRFERTRLFGRIRRIFREAGRRLHADGLLPSPDDVFYLQVDEIVAFVDGTAVTKNLAELASVRRAEFAEYKASNPPPDRLVTTGPVLRAHPAATAPSHYAPDATAEERCGIACCPGVVRGRVRVILDPRAAHLTQGSILVAEHTDPGWIMLFPSAKGLLVERGSLLSHSAIVARELGIPAVLSIRGLTSWLRDGDLVELDGSRGTVRRLASEVGHVE